MPFISASAISLYNKIRGGAAGPAETLLLDLYPGAVAAYSVRKLTNAYEGDAIEVRRTVGTPTNKYIGFVDDELDTASLLNFVGTSDGSVPIWYDQSGNNNNQTQESLSLQPDSVDSGTLLTFNENPTIRFDNGPYMQTLSAVSLGSPSELWFYAAVNIDNASLFTFLFSSSATSNNDGGFIVYIGGNDLYVGIRGATYVQLKTPITEGNYIISVRLRGGQTAANAIEVYINSQQAPLTVTNNGTSNATFNDFIQKIGVNEGNIYRYIGSTSELLIKTGDQSANRAGIESNINSYYNMYWDGSQTGLLDDYPGSTAAYSLRALNSAYTGYAIRVRRSSDGDFKDIGLLYDGSLDTESLLSFVGSGNATVQTWYDQSGEGNNAVQGTLSRQPNIVESGVLVTMLDEPAMDTTSQPNSGFVNSSPSNFKPANSSTSIFVLGRDSGTAASTRHLLAYSNVDIRFAYLAGSNVRLRSQIWNSNGTSLTTEVSASTNIPFIGTSIRGQSFQTVFNNGVQGQNKTGLPTPSANTTGTLSLFSLTNNFSFEGFYSELIFYPSDQIENRAGIESNINSNYNIYWDGSQDGLLDDYPNAAAAYSLRALSSEYTGAAIKVRKTVDSVTSTRDIGLLYDGTLDTESLLSFAGSDDVYVQIWYDQSGEGNDATQVSASAQPQIVSSGLVIEVNNVSAIDFDGIDNYLETSTFTEIEQPTSYFGVFKFDSNKNQNIFDSSLNARQLAGDDGTNYKFFGGSTITGGITNTNQNSFNGIFNSTDSLFVNNTSVVSGNAGTNGIDKIVIASNYPKTGAFLDGKIQELILYPSDQSANRAGIESNINSNYNIYWDGSQTGLLDDYPNATAAYSLRALNSAYTGPAIRVTTTGSDFKDIGLLYDGSLDTASLLTFAGGGDVFVTTWYDQSGEGNDVAQGSQSAQPQIVSSGVVVTTSDNYAIDFSGSTKTLVNATFDNLTQVSSVFTIVKSTSSAPQVITDGVDLASRQVSGYYANNPSAFAINKGVTIKSAASINQNINLLSTFFDVNSDLYLNGVQILNSVDAGSNTREGFTLGSALGSAASFEGSIFEVIVFDEQNKSSDRTDIETNINNYYNVY